MCAVPSLEEIPSLRFSAVILHLWLGKEMLWLTVTCSHRAQRTENLCQTHGPPRAVVLKDGLVCLVLRLQRRRRVEAWLRALRLFQIPWEFQRAQQRVGDSSGHAVQAKFVEPVIVASLVVRYGLAEVLLASQRARRFIQTNPGRYFSRELSAVFTWCSLLMYRCIPGKFQRPWHYLLLLGANDKK